MESPNAGGNYEAQTADWLAGGRTLEYRENNDPQSLVFGMLPCSLDREWVEGRADTDLYRRTSNTLSPLVDEFFESEMGALDDYLVGKLAREIEGVESDTLDNPEQFNKATLAIADQAEFDAIASHVSLFSFFDALADCPPGQFFTGQSLAEGSLNGLDRSSLPPALQEFVAKGFDFDATLTELAEVFIKHAAKDRSADLFRWRDRWFSLEQSVSQDGVTILAHKPLLVIGKYQLGEDLGIPTLLVQDLMFFHNITGVIQTTLAWKI